MSNFKLGPSYTLMTPEAAGERFRWYDACGDRVTFNAKALREAGFDGSAIDEDGQGFAIRTVFARSDKIICVNETERVVYVVVVRP